LPLIVLETTSLESGTPSNGPSPVWVPLLNTRSMRLASPLRQQADDRSARPRGYGLDGPDLRLRAPAAAAARRTSGRGHEGDPGLSEPASPPDRADGSAPIFDSRVRSSSVIAPV
jgi:hypothetical protein